MKRHLFILMCCIGITTSAGAAGLEAFLSYATFYSPEQGPYVETYIMINGSTVAFSKGEDGRYRAQVEIALDILKGEEHVYTDRHVLVSPSISDATAENPNFLDQHRVALPNGQYVCRISLKDLDRDGNEIQQDFTLDIGISETDASLSDLEMVESYENTIGPPGSFSKSGKDIIPFPMEYFGAPNDKLIFYAEAYRTDTRWMAGQKFLVRYYIERYENEQPMSQYSRFVKMEAAPVNVVLGEFPLKDLRSGNYNLVVELRDTANQLVLQKKKYFQRSNPASTARTGYGLDASETFVASIGGGDTLMECIRCLYPVSQDFELQFAENAMKSNDEKLMRNYFYGFWVDRNPDNPEKAWNDYKAQVLLVDKMFGTKLNKGYATDRGRVYLKYGAPNSVSKEDREPSAYPYEIWHYYKLQNQTNRRFVFYNPDLVTDEFVLLHSDARGEIYNSQWDVEIHRRTSPVPTHDDQSVEKHFGGHTKDLYRSPR